MAMEQLCSVAGCGKPVKSCGYCVAHYKRFWRHGDPLAGRIPNGEAQKFLQFALSYDGDDCLIWPYANINGYGCIRHKGNAYYVSRLICETIHGPQPAPRYEAAHSCGRGTSGCVSPKHIQWKTCSDNNLDKVEHDTHNRGERNWNAKLTEQEARSIFNDERHPIVIAKEYEVSEATVYDIKSRRSWYWLSMDDAA